MDSLTKPDPTTLVMKRRIAAPPHDVYAAWVEPELIAKWFGGNPAATVSVHSADVRIGGNYDLEIIPDDGTETHRVRGTYQDVVPGERLSFSWAWASTPDRQSQVTVEFKSDGPDATILTLTHERFFDDAARDRHAGGWTRSMERLGELFKATAA